MMKKIFVKIIAFSFVLLYIYVFLFLSLKVNRFIEFTNSFVSFFGNKDIGEALFIGIFFILPTTLIFFITNKFDK